MKRIFLLLLSCVLISSMALAQKDMTIKKFSADHIPELDGTVNDSWKFADANNIEVQSFGNLQSAKFRLAWSDEAFHLIVEVKQNPFRPVWVTGGQAHEADRPEVYFNVSGTPRANQGANFYGASPGWREGFYQYVATWSESPANQIQLDQKQVAQAGYNSYIDHAWTRDDDAGEWIYELRVPHASLLVGEDPNNQVAFVPEAGIKIGFELSIVSTDDENNRIFNHFSSQGGYPGETGVQEAWATFSGAAEVTLSDDILEEVDEEPGDEDPSDEDPTYANVSKSSELSIYPNPANHTISITLERPTNVFISNINGSVVKFVENSNGTINVSELAPGLYIVRADNFVGRFIKK